jgi:hypothetical protein
VLLLGAAAAGAPAQVKLEWKLKEGDTFFLEEKVSAKDNVKLLKTDHPYELAFTRVTRFHVLKRNEDGGYLLEQKIESIKLDPSGTTGKADAKLVRAEEGTTFRVTLTPKLEVAKLEGYEAFVKKLAKSDDVAKNVRILMPPTRFASATAALFSLRSGKEVAKGDSWTQEYIRPLGPLGSVKIESTCTLRGTEKIEDREVVKVEVSPAKSLYSLPQADGDAAFKVVKGDIRVERDKSAGTIYFSAALGRMVKSVTTLQLSGSLTATIMGATIAMDVEHEEKVTARILDKNPL